jgi:hypothetical protein
MSYIEKDVLDLIEKANIQVPLTDPGKHFTMQASRTIHILFHLINLSQLADNAANVYWNTMPKDELIGDKSAPPPKDQWIKYVQEQSPVLMEMIFCRLVDSFLTYFSETIRIILQKRPEILKSSATIQIDYVLKFSNYDELIQDLIDAKIIELGYKGFKELNRWCEDRIGETISWTFDKGFDISRFAK